MKQTSLANYENSIDLPTVSDAEFREKSRNFRLLLAESITLGMFVPCDENGNVLEEPKGYKCCGGILNDCDCRGSLQYDSEEVYKYQQAKENVLFEGFEKSTFGAKNGMYEIYFGSVYTSIMYADFEVGVIKTIEDLVKYNLTLTASPIKNTTYETNNSKRI